MTKKQILKYENNNSSFLCHGKLDSNWLSGGWALGGWKKYRWSQFINHTVQWDQQIIPWGEVLITKIKYIQITPSANNCRAMEKNNNLF